MEVGEENQAKPKEKLLQIRGHLFRKAKGHDALKPRETLAQGKTALCKCSANGTQPCSLVTYYLWQPLHFICRAD